MNFFFKLHCKPISVPSIGTINGKREVRYRYSPYIKKTVKCFFGPTIFSLNVEGLILISTIYGIGPDALPDPGSERTHAKIPDPRLELYGTVYR